MAAPEAAQNLHKQTRHDVRNGLKRTALNSAYLTAAFIGSQALHGDPTFFQNHFSLPLLGQVSVPLIDGIGQAIYTVGDNVGGVVNSRVPGADALPHLLAGTPVNNVLHGNFIADVEAVAVVSGIRQLFGAGRRSAERNIKHATEAHEGKHLDGAPDDVKRHVQSMSALRKVLTVADIALEAGETAVDGPLPYGLRDLDAAGFWAAKWHPLTGEMTGLDRTVLLGGILAPYVPPVIPLGIWVTLKHMFKPHQSE